MLSLSLSCLSSWKTVSNSFSSLQGGNNTEENSWIVQISSAVHFTLSMFVSLLQTHFLEYNEMKSKSYQG